MTAFVQCTRMCLALQLCVPCASVQRQVVTLMHYSVIWRMHGIRACMCLQGLAGLKFADLMALIMQHDSCCLLQTSSIGVEV